MRSRRLTARPSRDVQRANMLLGDIGATLRLATEGWLGDAQMRLFHPIGIDAGQSGGIADED